MAVDDGPIFNRVKMALATDERTALTDVVVEVVDGIVYLRGEVEAEGECDAAVQVVGGLEGVREVRCHLSVMKVRPPSTVQIDLPDSRPFVDDEGTPQ